MRLRQHGPHGRNFRGVTNLYMRHQVADVVEPPYWEEKVKAKLSAIISTPNLDALSETYPRPDSTMDNTPAKTAGPAENMRRAWGNPPQHALAVAVGSKTLRDIRGISRCRMVLESP